MADVRHLPVVGRRVTKVDYADPHEVELDASDITDALGYTPADAAAPATPVTDAEIIAALGYVPADAADILPPPDLAPYATDADLAAGLATKANALLVIEAVTGTSYTIQPTDTYAAKALTNAALVTIVVPNDLAIPVGARCRFGTEGAAGAIVSEAPGVVIVNRGNKRAAAQGSIFELHKRAATTWWLLGDVQ